ncbi:MAG: hypothetical protein ABEH43_06310, partial [Flavobacteriales bacterium]
KRPRKFSILNFVLSVIMKTVLMYTKVMNVYKSNERFNGLKIIELRYIKSLDRNLLNIHCLKKKV